MRKGDGMDIDHKNHNTKDMSAKNISVMDRSKNRAMNQYDKRKKTKAKSKKLSTKAGY